MKDNHNYIYRQGTTPETRVVVSQKNKVYSVSYDNSSFSQIGVVSSFDPGSENKTVNAVRGVGYGDQIAENVPGVTDPLELTISRQLLYLSNLHQVLGYKGGIDGLVRSLKHHKWPFDLKHELVFSRLASKDQKKGSNGIVQSSDGVNEALITFYEACWITSYTYATLEAEGAELSEEVSVQVTDIVDGKSSYGELADSNPSTGNNPFTDTTGGSVRFNGGPGPSQGVGGAP